MLATEKGYSGALGREYYSVSKSPPAFPEAGSSVFSSFPTRRWKDVSANRRAGQHKPKPKKESLSNHSVKICFREDIVFLVRMCYD